MTVNNLAILGTLFDFRSLGRRGLLTGGALLSSAVAAVRNASGRNVSQPLRNALKFGNLFALWQSPYGSSDPVKCPYRTPGSWNAYHLHLNGPAARALYRLYARTGVRGYKETADRYAVFMISTLYEPVEAYVDTEMLNGQYRHMFSAAFMYGKALSHCYECFRQFNPKEDGLELKAYAIYRWLQRHRRADSYFGVGYPGAASPDAQFTVDLGEVGAGLVGFYNASAHQPALDDALGLANFFLTDLREGSGRGVWSRELGAWVVGPWPGTGAEQFTNQQFNKSARGQAQLVPAEFLLSLRPHTQDPNLRAAIADKCVSAFRWCMDNCQFEDGAHGMFGRDDKWVGQTAMAVLLYTRLRADSLIPPEVEKVYHPKVNKSWRWLVDHTRPDNFPSDGYIRVSGATTKKPLENLVWHMAWTVEALIEGEKVFEPSYFPAQNRSH